MDFFDKATKVAKEVGSSVKNTATNVSNTIGNVTREQTELANLKIQKNTIERKLEGQYIEIGKKYVSYIADTFHTSPFDVMDILEEMKPDLEKLSQLDEQIEQREQQIRQNSLERDKKKAQEQYENEVRKLDKAKALDVITEAEYQEKLNIAAKRVEYFEELRKIEMQYEMDIISKEEYQEKVKSILN